MIDPGRVRTRQHRHPDPAQTRFWTWQTEEALGTLLGGQPFSPPTTEAIIRDRHDDGFLAGYLWLERALVPRLGAPPPGGRFPVWLYRARRDARPTWRAATQPQPVDVKLGIQLPAERFVQSGLHTWASACAGVHLRLPDGHLDAWDERFMRLIAGLHPPRWQGERLDQPLLPSAWLLAREGGQVLPAALNAVLDELQGAWPDLFDLTACRTLHPNEIVQACAWELRPEDLISSRVYPAHP